MNKKVVIIIAVCLFISVFIAGVYVIKDYKGAIEEKNNNQADNPEKNTDKILSLTQDILNEDNNKVCEQLQNEEDKINCFQSYFIKEAANNNDLDKCNELADGAAFENCLAQTSFSLAIKTGDEKYCAKISNQTDKDNCLKGVADKKLDTDGDGLSDAEEISRYQTDPLNSDTDGDGYKDGDEVKNGYNPKGSGKLEK